MLRCSPTCRGLLLAAAMVALLAGPAQSLPRTLNMAVDPEGPPVTLPETLPNLAQSQVRVSGACPAIPQNPRRAKVQWWIHMSNHV